MGLGLHLITQSLGQDGHIVSILLGGVAIGTASRSLWLLVRIPIVEVTTSLMPFSSSISSTHRQ